MRREAGSGRSGSGGRCRTTPEEHGRSDNEPGRVRHLPSAPLPSITSVFQVENDVLDLATDVLDLVFRSPFDRRAQAAQQGTQLRRVLLIGLGDDALRLGRKLAGGVDDGSQRGGHGGCLIAGLVDVPASGAFQRQD